MRKEPVRMPWLLAIVVASAWEGAAQAADRFVSILGDDAANTCLASGTPCRTIAYAETQAASGDVVKVAEGRYEGVVSIGFGVSKTLTFSGSWKPDFSSRDAAARSTELSSKIFVDAPAGQVVGVTVDGFTLTRASGIEAESSGDGALTVELLSSAVRRNSAPAIIAQSGGTSTLDVVVSGATIVANRVPLNRDGGLYLFCATGSTMTLTMTDSSLERTTVIAGGTGIRAIGEGSLTASLTRVSLARNRGPGVLSGGANVTLTDVTITGNGSGGVVLVGGSASVTNSVVARNRGIGIYMSSSPAGALQVVNSTIRRNRARCSGGCAAGLVADGTVDLLNAVVWDNRARAAVADDVLIVPSAAVDVDHSDLGDVSGTYNDLGGNVSVDPSFVNRRDEHLTASSPLVDAGTCTGAPATDFDGDPRPTGAGCDIGADEFVP